MNKSVRDAVVTGVPVTLVQAALMEQGFGVATASLCAVIVGFISPFVYRLLRARFPDAFSFDAHKGGK